MRIGVLGGLGFVGSHVVDFLVDDGYEVLVVDDSSSCWLDLEGDGRFENPGATYVGSLPFAKCDEVDVVVDAALRHPISPEMAMYRLALDRVDRAARLIMDGALARTLRRYVVVSSIDVFADRPRILGRHLRAFVEALAYLHRPPHLDVEFVHLPELYGPRQLPEAGPLAAALNGATTWDSPTFSHLGFVRDAAAVVVDRALYKGHRKSTEWKVKASVVDSDVLERSLRRIGRPDIIELVENFESTRIVCPGPVDHVLAETPIADGLRQTVEFYEKMGWEERS